MLAAERGACGFDGAPCWVWMFPEGTRLTPARLAASATFQRDRGLEPMSRVLYPRMKGFTSLWRGLEHSCGGVIDVTISLPTGAAPTLPGLLRGEGG